MASATHPLTTADEAAPPAFVPTASWWSASDEQFGASYPITAPPRAGVLNRVLVRTLQAVIEQVPDEETIKAKPLLLQLALPLPPRLRFYVFLATQHESERQVDTYRIQLTTGDMVTPGRYRFSRADGIRPVLIGFAPSLDVFIIWDADVNDAGGGFPHSQGVQAPPEIVYRALSAGVADGTRFARRAATEEAIVVARRDRLVDGLLRRIELSNAALTGSDPC